MPGFLFESNKTSTIIETKKYTLITGASHGIGKEMARVFAEKKHNLILVALPGPELKEQSKELQEKYSVDVRYFGVDLTDENAPKSTYEWCKQESLSINILINNAGIGTGGIFENLDLTFYNKMIKLNNQALVGMTYHFIPELKKHSKAFILNTSSLEAALPLPYKSVYAGTKNFIYSFSLALREELKSHNIQVSVLCPGPVVTNEEGLKRINSQGAKAKIIVKMPDYVAEYAIRKMFRGKTIIIPGAVNKGCVKLGRILPTLLKMWILERVFRVYKDH
ncbi:SDR family NAD(P)-dependent oxidoreductase [Rapidithrix thailandica]|uniref:SDR family NAD(P)-dependent oxidoreductase n=1 Tax=Rapidithrix thailandica TaxID=413964 RepID=A0AAW9RW90_9BACT